MASDTGLHLSAATYPGLEPACAAEMRELLSTSVTSVVEEPGVVTAELSGTETLPHYLARVQCALRVFIRLVRADGATMDELAAAVAAGLDGPALSRLLSGGGPCTFRVAAKVDGTGAVVRDAFERELLRIVKERLPEGRFSADLKAPRIIFFCQVMGDACHFGIDAFVDDIAKRDYKLFAHRASIGGVLAASLLRMVGYAGQGSLIDPFCGCGTIPIEAAYLASGAPVNGRKLARSPLGDLIRYGGPSPAATLAERSPSAGRLPAIHASDHDVSCIAAVRKNAKAGKVDGIVSSGRNDAAHLGAKHDDGSVAFIVSDPPQFSKATDHRRMERLYGDFLDEAWHILIPKGRMALLMHGTPLAPLIKKAGLVIVSDHTVRIGRHFTEERHVIICEKR
ncbi:hypothetical protein JXB02_03175 [Candidatus Woesearchaeota archaeon]|nr:hypothetical protein [Candidatus Woesearchaeota archaeon]